MCIASMTLIVHMSTNVFVLGDVCYIDHRFIRSHG